MPLNGQAVMSLWRTYHKAGRMWITACCHTASRLPRRVFSRWGLYAVARCQPVACRVCER